MYTHPASTVLSIIKSLKDSAADPDCIKRKVIEEVRHELAASICQLLNLSLRKGISLDKLEVMLITPVFKKGVEDIISNYRPISVLNVFSKIFENCSEW